MMLTLTADQVSRASVSKRFGPPYPAIMKSVSHHLFRRIDVPEIHDDERMGAFRTSIGIVTEGDVFKYLPGLRHADRIEDTNLRAHVLQRRNQRDRRRIAHVIGIGFERDTQ